MCIGGTPCVLTQQINRHWPNVHLILVHPLGCWLNINTTVGQHAMFAGLIYLETNSYDNITRFLASWKKNDGCLIGFCILSVNGSDVFD